MTPLLWPLWWVAMRSSASSTATSRPARPRAMAVASPTRPPPATATEAREVGHGASRSIRQPPSGRRA